MIIHAPGCPSDRAETGADHDLSAYRLYEAYNLHKLAGMFSGWIVARLEDGRCHMDLFPSRNSAVHAMAPYEYEYAYVKLSPAPMVVCEAAGILRFHREAAKIQRPDLDHSAGGLEIIPRITLAGRENQIAAMRGRLALPVAMGRSN